MLLKEFLDENTHRCYPFSDINSLPTDLLVDAHFVTSDNVRKDSLYINKVVVTNNCISFYIAYKREDNELRELGLLTTIAITEDYNTEHLVFLVHDTELVVIEGSITIGNFDTINNTAIFTDNVAVYDLGESGNIFEACVIPLQNICTGLVINDRLYSGNVTLQFGEGLEIKEVEGEKNVLEITAVELVEPEENKLTDEALVKLIAAQFGDGVRTLNGLSGDITISTGAYNTQGYSDSASANKIDISTSEKSIIVSNSVDNPNFDATGNSAIDASILAQLSVLIANAQELNNRAGTLEQHNYALENAMTMISGQMSKAD